MTMGFWNEKDDAGSLIEAASSAAVLGRLGRILAIDPTGELCCCASCAFRASTTDAAAVLLEESFGNNEEEEGGIMIY